MSAAAERILEEIKSLSPGELEEVWREISLALNGTRRAPARESAVALEAIHSLYGRFAGGSGLARLLRERAKDRGREEEKCRRLSHKHA